MFSIPTVIQGLTRPPPPPPPLSLSLSPPLRVDNLQQAKARLEVANQTLKGQHQKELEGREEEVEAMKTNMNKKLKALGDQIEELHEEKQAAIKVSWHSAKSCRNSQDVLLIKALLFLPCS